MFSRRPAASHNRGRIATVAGLSSPAPFSPSNAAGVIDWWQSFAGGAVSDPKVTVTGSGVSSWQGQLAGFDLVQATDTNRPARIAADATLSNLQVVDCDGVDNYLRCATFTRPAPGTTPTYLYTLWRLNTWTANRVLIALGSAALTIQCLTSSPRIVQTNPTTVNGNDGLTGTATWKRSEFLFNADVSDFSHVGGLTVTGASAGNNAGTQMTTGGNNGLTTFTDITYAFILVADRMLALQDAIALDAYLESLVGSAVLT